MYMYMTHHGSHATFLDLEIEIKDGVFVYELFDKRDAFSFEIVRMPFICSDTPYLTSYMELYFLRF